MKYNVGDKVRIKSLDWYNKNKDILGNIECGDALMNIQKSQFCGKIITISSISDVTDTYEIEEDNGQHIWTDDMFEHGEEHVHEITEDFLKNIVDDIRKNTSMKSKELMQILGVLLHPTIDCPEGYVFKDENGNVINATKIVLEKKKKEYPKTYEECLSVLKIKGYDIVTYVPSWTEYEKALYQEVLKLRELIICRDAYWKLYGEEMGLGKPWEPDFTDKYSKSYVITAASGIIHTTWTNKQSYILAFPSEEMRDAFYENFKEEIESVKGLL